MMEVEFTQELEQQLRDLAAATGRSTGQLVQDAMAGYVSELTPMRNLLDSRYDDIKSGRVQLIDGESFFESLRLRELALLDKQPK